MELKRLKQLIDKTIEVDEDNKYLNVVITLSEPSVGGRMMTNVSHANAGFDWERGQFRIEPEEKIVRFGKSKEDVNTPIEKNYYGKVYFSCKVCNVKVSKNDRYCKRCGQKLK
jgi:hypothetical protein